MKLHYLLIPIFLLNTIYAKENTKEYIHKLEKENNISYSAIKNSRALYITSMCYTKVKDKTSNKTFNPCYSCHTKGKEPNYINDSDLQLEYNFPQEILKNPYSNFLKDRSKEISKISDKSILNYVKESNYFNNDGSIALKKALPKDWMGYVPDCYYNFDSEGFDRDKNGKYTGWRAFGYYPFLGTFWPTNGSTDDVLIRLPKAFRVDSKGKFNKEIYKLNLSIVESVVKQKNIALEKSIDEKKYGVDLNQNGKLDFAKKIVFNDKEHFKKMSYVGLTKEALQNGKVHLAGGLFPQGVEFLHSVRYLDWSQKQKSVVMAARMKELRYAKKLGWANYSELERAANSEFFEAEVDGQNQTESEIWQGNFEEGLKTGTGWVFQGFIESKNGKLRPQTHEETINCMGCHAGIGATTDNIFSFARKFEGINPKNANYGWRHWSQRGIKGVAEPKANYLKYGTVDEYSFYLQNNHSGNEFRDNQEVKEKFFNKDGTVKKEMLNKLHKDISILLLASKKRALQLDKAYKTIVQEQSFIYGRGANSTAVKNIYKEVKKGQETGIKEAIVQTK